MPPPPLETLQLLHMVYISTRELPHVTLLTLKEMGWCLYGIRDTLNKYEYKVYLVYDIWFIFYTIFLKLK